MQSKYVSRSKCILVGAGSIGLAHLEDSITRFSEIHVVDTNSQVLKNLNLSHENRLHPKILTFSSVLDKNLSSTYDLAVIANWGPGHFEVFKVLSEKEVGVFIIEKPLSDSLLELEQFSAIYNAKSSKIFVNFALEFSPLLSIISSTENLLGSLRLINVSGGAKCIATNGIHWLSFTSRLFGSQPISTLSNLISHSINPRDNKFLFLEGSASWQYDHGRSLSINFSNFSHLALRVDFIFENGHASLENGEFLARKISKDMNYLPFTRTFKPDLVVSYFENFYGNSTNSMLTGLYDTVLANAEDNFEHSKAVNSALIATLISSEESRTVRLPLDISNSPHFKRKWYIS